MTCSDSFFCSSGSRSYKSLRAPHPFAEWLHGNCTSVLLLTLKTFISDPRMPPPSSTARSTASLCQPWVFLKYLMLTTCFLWGCLRHVPGEARASCARGPGQRLWRHADLLYRPLVFSPFLLLHLSFLSVLTPFLFAHSHGFSSFPRVSQLPTGACSVVGPGSPPHPGLGLYFPADGTWWARRAPEPWRSEGRWRRHEKRSGRRTQEWAAFAGSRWNIWVALSPGEGTPHSGVSCCRSRSASRARAQETDRECGDPCNARLHCVSDTSARSRKGLAARVSLPFYFLHGNHSLSF